MSISEHADELNAENQRLIALEPEVDPTPLRKQTPEEKAAECRDWLHCYEEHPPRTSAERIDVKSLRLGSAEAEQEVTRKRTPQHEHCGANQTVEVR